MEKGIADVSGEFAIATAKLDAGDYQMTANIPYLYRNIVGKVERPAGELKFVNVPQALPFGQTTVPTNKKVVTREDAAWKIDVEDTRNDTANWTLHAAVTNPLTPNDLSKPVLRNSLIYINANNQKVILNENPILIQEVNGAAQQTAVQWSDDKGILLEVNSGDVYSNTTYEGRIQWILQDTP